ncbi:MAG TPA: hypothetical protein VHQ94_23955 [Pyrinomonadaceae bacterium]|jgi:hypothetical protein|nr:hypothetical protein [Pyrinomonadaceae bacterium]
MKKLIALTLTSTLFYAAVTPVLAQDKTTAQQPTAEELEKKAEREKNAYQLLDQVIDEAQSLRLTENRVRVQVSAADMLWDKNQGRARSLFQMAGEGIAELGRTPQPNNNRRPNEAANQDRRAFQLRQELVLAAAKHDAQLAYQLLATTKPAAPVVQVVNDDQRTPPRPQFNTEDNLEQILLGRIAAIDPKLAAQNAEQMMDKGQFPRTISEVINQLYRQDAEAGAKLADKTVKKIQSANILTNNEATLLAQAMLNAGVRQPGDVAAVNTLPAGVPIGSRVPTLEQSAYIDLLSAVIDAALKAAPPARTATTATPAPQRGRIGGGPQAPVATVRPGQGNAPTDSQIEQANARRLIASLMIAMPVIEQQLPTKASAVKAKLNELGAGNLQGMGQPLQYFPQQNPTVDSLMQAAAAAKPPMQNRLYQQAAFKALEEGNTDRARQIATDHLTSTTRDSVLQRIQYRELALKADSMRFDEIRQMLNGLQTENEKLNFLLQLAGDAQKANPKLTLQLLDEARQMTNRRATSYDHFEQQLRVARAFAPVDPGRSFEVLEPAISQINELLAAAAILNGFEMNMFRDGEMTIMPSNGLTSTINRFGQELATLAANDFERAEVLAGRFQIAEARIITRLAIVQGLLNPRQTSPGGPQNFTRVSENVARPN